MHNKYENINLLELQIWNYSGEFVKNFQANLKLIWKDLLFDKFQSLQTSIFNTIPM